MVNLSSVARLKNSHQGNVNYQRKVRGLNQQVKERCLALNLSEGRTFPFFHLVLSLLGSQSYLGCCYLKAEPFFFFFHLVLPLLCSQSYLGCCYLKAAPGSVSLGQSVLFRLLLSEGRNFPFFSPGSVSLGQSVLFELLLSEGRTFPFFSLGSVSLGQSVLFGLLLSEGRTFPFFSPGSVSLGQSVLFGLLLSEGRTFLFFYLVLSILGSLFILDSFLFQNKLVFSMNLSKIKFTRLDCTYLFLCRFNSTLTMKSRDEKAMFF